MNRQVYVIFGSLVIIILAIIGIFILANRSSSNNYTGGSLQLEAGYLVLRGYETPSNDRSKIPLGQFLSTGKQVDIRTSLQAVLYKNEVQEEYTGTVVPGSVNVNYLTNIIEFKAKIEKPEVTYTVRYNTISEELTILDENNQVINAS
jgi:hypothetical protein